MSENRNVLVPSQIAVFDDEHCSASCIFNKPILRCGLPTYYPKHAEIFRQSDPAEERIFRTKFCKEAEVRAKDSK